jgi:hypothetical protein
MLHRLYAAAYNASGSDMQADWLVMGAVTP